MKELLSFDTLLMPKVITILYYVGLLVVLLSGVAMIFQGSILGGVLTLAVGAIGVRMYCELLIVIFKMNEALQEIRKK